MKQLVFILSILLITGCSSLDNTDTNTATMENNGIIDNGNSGNHGGETGNNGNSNITDNNSQETGGDNNQNGGENNIEEDSSLYIHSLNHGINSLNDFSGKTLTSTIYFYDNKQEKKTTSFSIKGNNSPVIKEESNNYYKHHHETTDRELLDEYITQSIKELDENNIKPINYNNGNNIYLKSSQPQNIKVGDAWNNIYVSNINGSGASYNMINATCIAVSNHAYFFLQNGLQKLTSEQISEITYSFDKDYKVIHEKFGEESDVDNNGKIIFLITDLPKGIMGFFFNLDKYYNNQLHQSQRYSNEADMLYINAKYFQADIWKQEKTNVLATFIHEFQHMTFFDTRTKNNLKIGDARWLNEGLSMISEYYGGYGMAHYNYVNGYFHKGQGSSLVTEDTSLDYGLQLLFTRYLQERFGDSYIKTIYISKETGKKAVEEAVNMDFDLLYTDFVKMVSVTGRNLTKDKRYNIQGFNYAKGSAEYNKSGFNLADIIDTSYSYNKNNEEFIATKGYNKTLNNYSFILTKWNNNTSTINLETNDPNIHGIYNIW